MTLEKLLIFGFALSVLTAIVTLADTRADNRDTEKEDWKTEVGKIADKAK